MEATPQAEMVRIYNNVERSFLHEHEKVRYVLPPRGSIKVPAELAEKWLAMFPGQVVTDKEAQGDIAKARSEVENMKGQLADKDAEIKALKEQLAKAAPAKAKKPAKAEDSI